MTTFRSATAARRVPRLRLVLALAGVLAAGLAAAGLLYLFARSTPAAVSLGSSSVDPGSSSAAIAAADATTSADPIATSRGASATTGTWTIDPSVGSFSDFTGSFVGYRVQEELASVGAATAVGRTPRVTGSVVLDGATITAVDIEADLSTLESDSSMRDGQLHRQALETDTYPTATFVLAEPIDLGSVAEGKEMTVTATGDLTIHGVTKRVAIPLEAQLTDGVVTVVGSIDITFADYGMRSPQSMMVLSIADHATLELQLKLTKS